MMRWAAYTPHFHDLDRRPCRHAATALPTDQKQTMLINHIDSHLLICRGGSQPICCCFSVPIIGRNVVIIFLGRFFFHHLYMCQRQGSFSFLAKGYIISSKTITRQNCNKSFSSSFNGTQKQLTLHNLDMKNQKQESSKIYIAVENMQFVL